MADVLIKNMEMPKGCPTCRFADMDGGKNFCNLTDKLILQDYDDYRCEECPLVELSSHGRLKDIDAILDRINRLAVIDELMYTSAIEGIKKMLDEFPTVIPASEI